MVHEPAEIAFSSCPVLHIAKTQLPKKPDSPKGLPSSLYLEPSLSLRFDSRNIIDRLIPSECAVCTKAWDELIPVNNGTEDHDF
jgi:hypothetical protein